MFYSRGGLHINLDHVKTITEQSQMGTVRGVARMKRFAIFTFVDGSQEIIELFGEGALSIPEAPIPCPPGFYLLWGDATCEPTDITKDPIVAWELDSGGSIWPITLDGINRTVDGILAPNGSVTVPDECVCDDVEHWLNYMRNKAAREEEC